MVGSRVGARVWSRLVLDRRGLDMVGSRVGARVWSRLVHRQGWPGVSVAVAAVVEATLATAGARVWAGRGQEVQHGSCVTVDPQYWY